MRKINPARIVSFNKLNFPFALPFLQLFLPGYCREGIVKDLEIGKLINIISLRETTHGLQLVLMSAPNEIVCNPNVKSAMLSAGENVNEKLLSHPLRR
jgi:hypothetical protein